MAQRRCRQNAALIRPDLLGWLIRVWVPKGDAERASVRKAADARFGRREGHYLLQFGQQERSTWDQRKDVAVVTVGSLGGRHPETEDGQHRQRSRTSPDGSARRRLPSTAFVAAELYLDLMKGCLTRSIFGTDSRFKPGPNGAGAFLPSDATYRDQGRDWPAEAETMIGLKRIDNVHECVVDTLRWNVPGDLVETGVWRGGTTIFMRAVLAAYGDTERTVWVADSFQGLPAPDIEHYPADGASKLHEIPYLAISLEQVKANFARYDLLDDQVRFLPGWFRDTLPTAPIEKIAVLRLDGDMYESTMDALKALYPKVSPGGYVIIDDYGGVAACRRAVHDYRSQHGVTEPVVAVDWTGAFWQKD